MRKAVALMVLSIRSGSGARSHLVPRRRAPCGAKAAALRTLAGFAALVVLLFFAVPAHADEIEPESEPAPQTKPAPAPEPQSEPKSEPKPVPDAVSEEAFSEPNWIPSIETGFEVFDYNVDTSVVNHINPPAYQATQHEAERQTLFRIGGELMGPMFEDLPGRPRLFVQGGALFQVFSSDKILGEGDPFVELEPERGVQQYNAFGATGSKELPGGFVGQGNEISARFENPSWYAGLGVAFSAPVASNLLLYIKPSIQYSMEKIDLPAGLTTVDEPNPGAVDPDPCGIAPRPPGTPQPPPCNREFFIYRSRATASSTDHFVGAGLEVALVPFRLARPIRATLYAQARFLWLVSDDSTEYGDPAGVASYSVVRDDFSIRGGAGLRFSWVGFD